MTTKILQVLKIEFSIQEINPPNLIINSEGEVNSGGWSDGELIPFIYVKPPKDGIYEFDFVAESPNGFVPQVISPIEANPFVWKSYPNDLKGIKVYASANSIIQKL